MTFFGNEAPEVCIYQKSKYNVSVIKFGLLGKSTYAVHGFVFSDDKLNQSYKIFWQRAASWYTNFMYCYSSYSMFFVHGEVRPNCWRFLLLILSVCMNKYWYSQNTSSEMRLFNVIVSVKDFEPLKPFRLKLKIHKLLFWPVFSCIILVHY